MSPFKLFKEELKEIAATIKTLKGGRKPSNFNPNIHGDLWKLGMIRNDYRHKHIAYCELRGRKREVIEIPRDNNKPNETVIDRIKNKWKILIDEYEAVRADAA